MVLPKLTFYIDVFGFCNLRCPSCPVGNIGSSRGHFQKGFMAPELLDAVLTKAKAECDIQMVGLFNWTEPLLHPDLTALLKVANRHSNHVMISSNLNKLSDPHSLMQQAPARFRVSVSGFNQDVYARAHRKGDIERVKLNMRSLALAKNETGAKVDLEVLFHRYNYNRSDEAAMRSYAESLGYRFEACWAMYMPAEKILAYLGHDELGFEISDNDRAVLGSLSIDLKAALQLAKQMPDESCILLDHQIVLDVNADVYLCCGTTSSPSNRIGNYLSLTLENIQKKKELNTLCGPCKSERIHQYFIHQESFTSAARY
jgi:pyruvate-formate lyase-activating enzyme